MGNKLGVVEISPDQAIKLLAIAAMLRGDDLTFHGYHAETAHQSLVDIAQEIALQVHQ